MIPAQELRIGNWGFYENTSEYCYVTSNILSEIDKGEMIIDPIELTPEVLIKCGFQDATTSKEETKHPTLGYWSGFHIEIEKEDNRIDKKKKNITRYFITLTKWDKVECFMFSRGYMNIQVKHLHQLQNLFFSLTGEELIVNLMNINTRM